MTSNESDTYMYMGTSRKSDQERDHGDIRALGPVARRWRDALVKPRREASEEIYVGSSPLNNI
jgi:hypothetical protein